jgi:hypothetical protein
VPSRSALYVVFGPATKKQWAKEGWTGVAEGGRIGSRLKMGEREEGETEQEQG